MRVTPMVAEVTSAGSSARIVVGNDSAVPLAYETHITRVEIDKDGATVETPADSDFLVFPPQGLVGAGASQTIRVQWLGDPALSSSRSYFLEIRQLPVPFDAGSGADRPQVHIQINYRIKALITVAPKNASSKVSVVSVSTEMIQPPKPPPRPGELGKPPEAAPQPIEGLKVVVENSGSRHALMGGVNWIFDGKDPSGKAFHIVIPAGKIGQMIGVGYLPPDGGERVFNVPFPQAVGGPVSLRFTE